MAGGGAPDVDVVVVGSGFGGSVAALRLTEKGYRVAVLEAGRRFRPEDFPTTSWDLRNFLWAPALGCTGIQRISLLRNVVVLSGAGVGGGSLVYANTLYRPLAEFYRDQQWQHITDWRAELSPYYDQAERMLGVTVVSEPTPSDTVMQAVAAKMGVAETFRYAPVGVYLGTPGVEVDDPYFGGAGPRRTGCLHCGECMTGCRYGAKNTLETNYLYLAERAGARILANTTAVAVRPRYAGGYEVEVRRTPRGPASLINERLRPGRARRSLTTDHVVFAAGTLGTQTLLHSLRDDGVLPLISRRLGELTRTNSEALLGATARAVDTDFSRGPAITSSIHPDDTTHIEPVRYGKGSNAMGLLGTLLVDGDGRLPRPVRFLALAASHPVTFLRSFSVRRWSERTVILLVMQSSDNSLTVFRRKGPVASPAHQPAGARRTKSELDPGGAHRGPHRRQGDRRHAGRNRRRCLRRADDCAHPRWLCDRRLRRNRCHRRLPPRARVPGAARGRRFGGLRQPRGEPVAHDHRAGRAGDGVLAEQG